MIKKKPKQQEQPIKGNMFARSKIKQESKILSKLKSRKGFAIILAAIILICLGGYLVFFGDSSDKTDSSKLTYPCSGSNSIVSRASEYLRSQNIDELNNLAGEIKQNGNYENDVDCLYILTISAINQGDSNSAREYYDLLTKNVSENDQITYSQSVSEVAMNRESLRIYVEGTEEKAGLLESQPRVGEPRDE